MGAAAGVAPEEKKKFYKKPWFILTLIVGQVLGLIILFVLLFPMVHGIADVSLFFLFALSLLVFFLFDRSRRVDDWPTTMCMRRAASRRAFFSSYTHPTYWHDTITDSFSLPPSLLDRDALNINWNWSFCILAAHSECSQHGHPISCRTQSDQHLIRPFLRRTDLQYRFVYPPFLSPPSLHP